MATGTTKSGSRRRTAAGGTKPDASTGGTSVPAGGTGPKGSDLPPEVRATLEGAGVKLNNPQVRDAIRQAYARIDEYEAQRRDLNAKIKAEREGLSARGLNRHALELVRRYLKLATEQRDAFDETYMIARSASGLPVQAALPLEPEEGGQHQVDGDDGGVPAGAEVGQETPEVTH